MPRCNTADRLVLNTATGTSAAVLWGALLTAAPSGATNLPTGGQVTGGEATISVLDKTMTINQASPHMSVNWQNFSIGAGYKVSFVQLATNSVALNRVLGTELTQIAGTLGANGRVFLVNPNGILFSTTARVSTGGLVASTLDLADNEFLTANDFLNKGDFLGGRYRFTGSSTASVTNQGTLEVASGGTLALLAKRVVNKGTLFAPMGFQAAEEGQAFTLDLNDPVMLQKDDGALLAQTLFKGPLERSHLLLGHLPAAQVSPVPRPGAETGTVDLQEQVSSASGVRAEVGADNHGDRYSGRQRVQASLQVAGAFRLGDQLTVNGQHSAESTQVAAVSYGLPLGARGLRAQAGWLRTGYRLGREFEPLGARGTARVLTAGLSYPLLRSQRANLRLVGTLQDTRLHDERRAVGAALTKQSRVLRLSVSGNRRDERSLAWGSLTVHLGRLSLDGVLAAQDAASARTAGFFTRYTLEAQGLQTLAAGLQVHARLSAQWAPRNLDASERFSLGGATRVRAWPAGEATGDQGALLQLEARWTEGAFEPYTFYDVGRVRINRDPWQAIRTGRSLAGYGLGLRWRQSAWHAEISLSRRSGHEAAETEPQSGRDHLLFLLGHQF